MAAGDEDPPLNPPDAVAPITDRDVSAARVDDKEEDPRIPPSNKRHGHQGDGLQQLVARLPDDVLADVLGRLAPRWLAASRCVCKAWRDAVDDRGLLRADLLPLSLSGIFIHLDEHRFPEFFSRPSSSTGARGFSGSLDFLPSVDALDGQNDGRVWNYDDDFHVYDHCNGLLLLDKYVVNPATRQWNNLPPHPGKCDMRWYRDRQHLVFDPTVSPHYEVFTTIPCLDNDPRGDVDPSVEESEWPPSPCKMHVFSSRSGCWEERSFVREGDAAGTVREMRVGRERSTAVYWRGALFIHCKADFVMRVSLSDNKYRVIQPPMGVRVQNYSYIDLVRSENGVYLASVDDRWLRVWVLDESCGQMNWILKHDKDLKPVLLRHRFDPQGHGPWILEDINYNLFLSSRSPKDNKKTIDEEIFEWNSDNDDALGNGDMVQGCYSREEHYYEEYNGIKILGFHPYKEIVFLSEWVQTGLAYHLNSSKLDGLGNIYPTKYLYFKELANEQEEIKSSFPYTPCWIEEFPGNN